MQVSIGPWLVLLSIVLAVEGGYLALGQSVQIGAAAGSRRRLMLAGAAFAFGIAIWAMHFTALLAAHRTASYLVLPALLSFLVGVLIAGTAVYAVSAGAVNSARLAVAGCLLAAAIVIMHGIGISALPARIVASAPALIVSLAVALAGCTLAFWLAAGLGRPLAGAVAFGLTVAAAHYVDMAGTTVVPAPLLSPVPVFSDGALAVVIALVAFALTVLFLLSLVPERVEELEIAEAVAPAPAESGAVEGPLAAAAAASGSEAKLRRGIYAPLGGAGAPPPRLADRLPVERDGATQFVPVEEVVAVQANAHYTYLFDGKTKLFCPLAIGEVESRLDRGRFIRVHRSHIVNIERVIAFKRSGDSETVELAAEERYTVPVSRSRAGWLKSRIGEKNGGSDAGST